MNSLLPDPTASLLDRIKISMVGLKMPPAIEVVDTCVSRLDRREITGLELVERLLLEELTFREDRRIRTALRMGRLSTVKTLTRYDFSFQLHSTKPASWRSLDSTSLRAARSYICWGRPAPARATLPAHSAWKPSKPARASRS
jgi:DNA replication protein DnaC